MNIGGLRVGPLSGLALETFLHQARSAKPTYDHVGSTLDPERYGDKAMRCQFVDVGHGPEAFAAARRALRAWVPQLGLGARLEPPDQAVELGATVIVVLRCGPLRVLAPDRIVAVIDEPRRFAFAYGTLPGHPERGEESFTADHLDNDSGVTIRVQAEPGRVPARAVAPLVRRLQAAALGRYLAATASYVQAQTDVSGPDICPRPPPPSP